MSILAIAPFACLPLKPPTSLLLLSWFLPLEALPTLPTVLELICWLLELLALTTPPLTVLAPTIPHNMVYPGPTTSYPSVVMTWARFGLFSPSDFLAAPASFISIATGLVTHHPLTWISDNSQHGHAPTIMMCSSSCVRPCTCDTSPPHCTIASLPRSTGLSRRDPLTAGGRFVTHANPNDLAVVWYATDFCHSYSPRGPSPYGQL
jgi:hypothetical protein